MDEADLIRQQDDVWAAVQDEQVFALRLKGRYDVALTKSFGGHTEPFRWDELVGGRFAYAYARVADDRVNLSMNRDSEWAYLVDIRIMAPYGANDNAIQAYGRQLAARPPIIIVGSPYKPGTYKPFTVRKKKENGKWIIELEL